MILAGEAVNASSGLGYNGTDEKGKARWNLVDNADILQIEVLVVSLIFTEITQLDYVMRTRMCAWARSVVRELIPFLRPLSR